MTQELFWSGKLKGTRLVPQSFDLTMSRASRLISKAIFRAGEYRGKCTRLSSCCSRFDLLPLN